jgi:nicotinate-nucleotide adenylyltransferase
MGGLGLSLEKRLGIFGGTFDPPHIGHQILAAEAAEQLHLASVLWVLTPDPPHKKNRQVTPLDLRIMLVQAAIEGEPMFELSRVDIDRSPPYYALDTVLILRDKYPSWELVYLVGADSLRDLPTWYRPAEFVAACDRIGVMCRPGQEVDLDADSLSLPGLLGKLELIDAPLLEISSSQIRKRISSGRSFRYFVPEAVHSLIERHGIYT